MNDPAALLALAIDAAERGDAGTLDALADLADDAPEPAPGWGDPADPRTAEAAARVKARADAYRDAKAKAPAHESAARYAPLEEGDDGSDVAGVMLTAAEWRSIREAREARK